jgi:hypothetical protein
MGHPDPGKGKVKGMASRGKALSQKAKRFKRHSHSSNSRVSVVPVQRASLATPTPIPVIEGGIGRNDYAPLTSTDGFKVHSSDE